MFLTKNPVCNKFERNGALPKDFLGLVKDARKSNAELLKSLTAKSILDDTDYNSDEDSNYKSEEEEQDFDLDYDEDTEVSLSQLLQDQSLDIRKARKTKKAPKKTPTPPKKVHFPKDTTLPPTPPKKENLKPPPIPPTVTQRKKEKMSQNTLTKQVIELSDTRLFCRYHCPQEFDGEFIVSDDKREIYVEREYRKSLFGEDAALGVTQVHAGTDHHNHILQVVMQDELKRIWTNLEEMGSDDPDFVKLEKKGNSIFITSRLFVLPYKVMPLFFDMDNQAADPAIDKMNGSGEWCTFVLHKQSVFTSPGRSKARRRTRNNETRNGMHERDEDSSVNQEEAQRQHQPWWLGNLGGGEN